MDPPEEPKPPTKPFVPYIRYSKSVWSKVKADNPGLAVCQLGSLVGAMWRNLDIEVKKKYSEEFAADKKKYDKDLKKYMQEKEIFLRQTMANIRQDITIPTQYPQGTVLTPGYSSNPKGDSSSATAVPPAGVMEYPEVMEIDDDDDDVLILSSPPRKTEEDKPKDADKDKSVAEKEATAVEKDKTAAKKDEKMSEEKKVSDEKKVSEEKEKVSEDEEDQFKGSYRLKLSSLDELTDIIDSKLQQMDFGSQSDMSVAFLQTEVKTQERKAKEINKIFSDCEAQLRKFREELEADQGIYGKQIESGSDSDDDVQFIETTYESRHTGLLARPTVLNRNTSQPGAVSPRGTPSSQMISILSQPPVNTQVTMMQQQQQQQQQHQVRQTLQPRQTAPYVVPTPKPIELAVGMKLYGKKSNDIWYKGSLVDIQNKDRPKPERKYKIKFDGKGMKVLVGMHTAMCDPPTESLPVGSRIIAMYKDDEATPSVSFYAGIIAELPSIRNNQRYLVFFDDGYAQYCQPKEIRRVSEQSKNVWEDIHPDSQLFIRSYLKQYPERPMVRLQQGQIIKTEWNGTWWTARVEEVDASLVKMFFESDKRVEWIYRGSTRLEPLFTELAHAEASKASGSKLRRHNLNVKSARKPYVEYTRQDEPMRLQQQAQQRAAPAPLSQQAISLPNLTSQLSQQNTFMMTNQFIADPTKKRSVARKSTAPKIDLEKRNQYQASSISRALTGRDMATVLQQRLAHDTKDVDEDSLGERMTIDQKNMPRETERKKFKAHRCGSKCIPAGGDDPGKYKGNNPLLIPMLYGWERQVGKQKNTGRRVVFYRAPCARRLRYLEEVDRWLDITKSQLTIDLFCYDPQLHTHSEFVPIKTFCDIKDLSYGKENVAISCVNGIDRQYPDYVEYSNVRIPAKGVHLNLNTEFLCGCDCTDGCRDPKKCKCIQLTEQATKTIPGGKVDNEIGYENRRLKEQLFTGIYECNVQCKCSKTCANRVAQNGLQLRLQVFKTEKRGWGLRCLDDIPAGGFICVYAGQLLTEQGANEDGQQYGDEYLAELDYIEVVERMKEGYESDVDIDIDKEGSDDDYGSEFGSESDSTYSGEKRFLARTRNRDRSRKGERGDAKEKAPKIILKRDTSTTREEAWSVKVRGMTPQQKTADWLKNIPGNQPNMVNDSIIILDSDEDEEEEKVPTKSKDESNNDGEESRKAEDGIAGLVITEPTSLNTENVDSDDSDKKQDDAVKYKTRATRASSRFHNLPDPKTAEEKKKEKEKGTEEKKSNRDFVSARTCLNDEFCYVMDAKSMGNLGRYLNHSCAPNVFVQNVFVDTHDLRFPWVAFFAAQYIRAGTELTWDYNYEVGSVPGKVLYCYCGAAECRGRLL